MRRGPATLIAIAIAIAAPAGVRASPSPAEVAAHRAQLGARVPGGFTVLWEPPFFVIGDEEPAVVRRRAEGTVAWAVRLLRQDFFPREPPEIIDIWLFADSASYVAHTWSIFGDHPDTPFGYYSESARALIMNIETGGGTLVHEIVHPFVAANFPEAPAWLNEGLGSLFEQCAEEGGHLRGLTNWRLADLQAAIRAGELPSFAALTHSSERAFYDEDPGTNYAQARYLLYYLQEQGLLRPFYQRFLRDRAADPTGSRSLRAILGGEALPAFQRRWEAWVLGLSFPPSR